MEHNLKNPAMVNRLDRDMRAITTLEYALIAAFITLLAGGAAQSMGAGIGNKFQTVTDALLVVESPLRVSVEVTQE